MNDQMNLLGIPPDQAPVSNVAALSSAQKEVIRLARRPEGVTALEAGLILHGSRHAGRGCKGTTASSRGGDWKGTRSVACCPWASSDGWDVLKRLRLRGLVHQRVDRGPYYAGNAA